MKEGLVIGTGFYYEYCPEDVESRYKLLVFDADDEPFLPLTDFYHDSTGRHSQSTALSYIQCLLPFFSWLESSNFQGKPVIWNDPPEPVRVAVEDYLMNEMACKVRDKDCFRFVNLTRKSPNTVSRFLSALKAFYKTMIQLRQYPYYNPLVDSEAILTDYRKDGVRSNKPRMPAIGGTEDPIPHDDLPIPFLNL